MTDQERAAMQQALECLKGVARGKYDGNAAEVCAALEDVLAQQAEPVEPVAEARYDGTLRWLEPHGVGLHRIQGPLFTAPPQRKPLTKERLLYIYNQLPNWGMDMDRLPQGLEKFARAIERAHGITDPQIADRLARHGIPMPEGDTK